ncbi:hypothetical protein BpHYR1_000398 [Brachionus plicatilis]|uniref:Uncharacterized protein n=1 Tax=Brachionus plicatilis TaxID=10195 RepID=A0A3M7Q4T3_BRAPC|nr:hypothetical protein BpHYR1_000398 [Brachionus plicatilis]
MLISSNGKFPKIAAEKFQDKNTINLQYVINYFKCIFYFGLEVSEKIKSFQKTYNSRYLCKHKMLKVELDN